MSILCCCRNRQPADEDTPAEAIGLPVQPPRARLSKTLSRSDTDMYLSSILASRAPSQLIMPAYHNIVDPEVVDVDDSDEDGPERDVREPNMGALGLIKTKLIRRLSHRANAKTGSRPCVGASDEELARRAELKRLMHKRIQEELKSEEEEEDDDLRLASLEPPSISNHREPELPGGGPRDTIEFSVSGIGEQETNKEAATISETSLLEAPFINRPQESRPRPTSRAASITRSIHDSCNERDAPLNELEPMSPPPSPSRLTPVHLLGRSGRASPSTVSWRLSYSAIHIESYIEPLIETRQLSRPQSRESLVEGAAVSRRENDSAVQDETTDPSQKLQFEHQTSYGINHKANDMSGHSVEASDGRYSPLDMWLRSQDSHCTSIFSSRSNSDMGLERPNESGIREQPDDLHKSQNFVGLSRPNGNIDNPGYIPRMHSSGAQPKSSERSPDDGQHLIIAQRNDPVTLNQFSNQIGNVLPEDPNMQDQVQDISSRYSSSRYTTRPNSRQATPGDSRLSLTEVLGSRRVLQPVAPNYGLVNPYRATTGDNSENSSYQTAPNKTPSLAHTSPNLGPSQCPTAGALSTNTSETASYKQREEELKSIEKRFGLAPARRYPMAPIRSKFREEFEEPKSSSNSKLSIFSRLYIGFPRRARIPSPHTEFNKSNEQTRQDSIGVRNLNTRLSSNLNLDRDHTTTPSNTASGTHVGEGVLSQPLHTFKHETNRRHRRCKEKAIESSMPSGNIDKLGARSIPTANQRPAFTELHNTDERRKGSVENPFSSSRIPKEAATSNEVVVNNTVDIHAGVFHQWVEQLQAEDVQRRSQMGSRMSSHKQKPFRLRTPPASWAKWPSFTREERTALAGGKDKVNSWDFALAIDTNPPESKGESKPVSNGNDLTATPRTLSSQVSKALKSGWNKVVTHTVSLSRASDHNFAEMRARASPRFLEYPELEFLPTVGGYKEVQALDQQISTMKRYSTSKGGATQQSRNNATGHPLASRIAEEIRKTRIQSADTAWDDGDYHSKDLSAVQFTLPAHPLCTHRSKSCDPQFGTSESQRTYEDCVQAQMLDDDDGKEDTDKSIIKRAKSTGNIEAKLSNHTLLMGGNGTRDHRAFAGVPGLRRHKSLGWIRGYRRSGERDRLTAVK
ncbi:hypothetical protein F4802DRAFT_429510 [Xylaria palmicola]|nr:hypothetical protein F4802DRAFT_429510 [Xylaria palmicola]